MVLIDHDLSLHSVFSVMGTEFWGDIDLDGAAAWLSDGEPFASWVGFTFQTVIASGIPTFTHSEQLRFAFFVLINPKLL